MDISISALVSLVIVSWNSAKYLPRCLDSLSSQTFQNYEVIIVDNGSTDSAITGLEKRYPNLSLRVERLAFNRGFAVANNLGASLARGKWLVLLNADAFPEPNWLAELISASELHPEVASFSSRQLQDNNPKILDGAGDAYHISGMAWRIGIGYPAEAYGLHEVEIFSPCAAAAMYLRQAFLEVGGFDEDFFSYFEDVDLGFRLQLHGYRSLYVPEAVVHHVGSGSLGIRSDFALYHTHRNLIWAFARNMPNAMLWRYLPAHLILNFIYVVYYALRGRGKILLRAKWDAVKGLSKALGKRARNHQNVDIAHLNRMMEHGLFKPYLLNYHLRQAWHMKKSVSDKN
jgi:GT2 family glycosyltransferase